MVMLSDYYVDFRTCVREVIKQTRRVREIIAMENESDTLARWKWVKTIVQQKISTFDQFFKSIRGLMKLEHRLRMDIKDMKEQHEKLKRLLESDEKKMARISKEVFIDLGSEKRIRDSIETKKRILVGKMEELMKAEQEIIVKQEDLEVRMQEVNLARTSYYHLTEKEIELFEVERPKVLAGVEKYGSIQAACKHDPSITLRPSSLYHYASKHKQFGEDVELAKQMFREALDAEIMDRALNGTLNPVFQRGEYIGDYAVKDNKLLVEVAKAKLPEQYNPRAYAQAHPATNQGTTINIISFDGVDESKRGYVKNVGVVQSVDETGKVERITQTKKMLDFYKNKPGAEIIDVEPEAPQSDEKAG